MSKKLYVGNLPFTATEDEVRELFSKHGTVHSVALITDRDTGRPRGFGFVEMENHTAAMAALDGYEMGGRALRVNEAEERRDRSSGGGGMRSGGGGQRGGGGGRGGRW
ncbi:RNA-binding protein [bacterium]|nr:RNA-binding protein [bacterium]